MGAINWRRGILCAACLCLWAAPADALEVSGYFDGVAAYSHVGSDYRGGTGAPGLFPGSLTLSTNALSCPAPPCAAGGRNDFTIGASEFKLNLQQDFEELVSVLGGISLHSAAAAGGPAAAGSSSDGQFDYLVQQAAARFSWKHVEVLFGRFYAPIGLEGVDADARPAATLSTSALALEPFFLTGAMVTWTPSNFEWGRGWSGFVFAANDLRGGNDDANASKALGIGVTRIWDKAEATLQYHLDWSNSVAPELEDATQLLALTIHAEGESWFGGIEALYRRENANIPNALAAGNLTGTAKMTALVGLLGRRWKRLSIGARGEWIHVRDAGGVLAMSAAFRRELAPARWLLGDGDVYGVSGFLTWPLVRGVFIRAEYRLDAADYDAIVASAAVLNPDTATAHLGLIQVNAGFE